MPIAAMAAAHARALAVSLCACPCVCVCVCACACVRRFKVQDKATAFGPRRRLNCDAVPPAPSGPLAISRRAFALQRLRRSCHSMLMKKVAQVLKGRSLAAPGIKQRRLARPTGWGWKGGWVVGWGMGG